MRVLVTGSAGFVGRHFVTEIERRGYDCLTTLDTRDSGAADCRSFFRRNPDLRYDLVLHCAALVDGRETIEGKAALLGAYNLQLDGALFEWALRARPGRILYFSSSAAYPIDFQRGLYAGMLLSERLIDRRNPRTPDASYGWTKLTGEMLADETRAASIPVTVVRPFSGYGEDQDDCYPFPAIVGRAARQERPFDVWGDGQQVRDFIHVDDIVAGALTLADQGVDGPVNLGTGRATSMDDLAVMAMNAAGYTAPIRHLTTKPQGVSYRVADTTLMRSYYEPTVTLEQGIDRALAHHVPNAAR